MIYLMGTHMTRRTLLGTGLSLLLVVAVAGCGKQAPSSETVIKIGQVSPLTGPQAHLGKDNDNGARLAIEEMNAKGLTIGGAKVKFELVSEDDQADPKTGTIVAQKLVDAKVAGVIGHLNSGTSIPASKLYADAGIPQISPSATAVKYTANGYKTTFRVMANDAQQGKVLGEYAVKLGARKIAVIDDRTAYGQGLADEFEKAAKASGAAIVGREYTSDRSTEFRAILTNIKGKQPDLVFYGGMDAQAGPMVAQMRSLGIKARFLGGDGTQSQEFIKLAGRAAAEGVVASSPGLPLETMPGGKAFSEKFAAKYGQIQIYAPYAYDATATLLEAMVRANSTQPAKYLPELVKTDRRGVSGPIAFDEKGDLRDGPITLYVVKGGKWDTLETVSGKAAAKK
jgi:branched-chain amino acid transport system substrate-binding protein